MKEDVIKSGDFSLGVKVEEDVLLLGGPGETAVRVQSSMNSFYLPDELELREGHDSLGRDNAKFYKI